MAGTRFIRSLDSGFSLRLPHRDEAYFETFDDPAGRFGNGRGFSGRRSGSSSAAEFQITQRKGRIRQSASRWCYETIPLDESCEKGTTMGLKAIDLLNEDEWDVPRRYGLVYSMGYGGGGEIRSRMNRVENHAKTPTPWNC
jgi:hypothetical protein